MKTTCIAIALIAWKWELAPAYREPPTGAGLDVDDEPDRARIACRCSCGLLVPELRFEPSEPELDCVAYGAIPRKRSAR